MSQSQPAFSNVVYDVITTLQSKLEACGVYETFVEDAREDGQEELAALFEEIWHDDERHAGQLATALENLARRGFRLVGIDSSSSDTA